jgi:hypothetical protein
VEAANAAAPTFTVHPLPLGAPVKIVALTAAAAAFLGISVHPCGGVPELSDQPTFSAVAEAAAALPVVRFSTPETNVPVIVTLAPDPAPAAALTVGVAPEPKIWFTVTSPDPSTWN